jgi:hypothetical protein
MSDPVGAQLSGLLDPDPCYFIKKVLTNAIFIKYTNLITYLTTYVDQWPQNYLVSESGLIPDLIWIRKEGVGMRETEIAL